MAVYFTSNSPKALLEEFDRRLTHPEDWRRIDAWVKNPDDTYTLKDEAWAGKASMKPQLDGEKLTFNIIKGDDRTLSTTVYSHYHGKLVEAFLRQLDLMFEMITSTSRGADGDNWA